MHRSRHGWAEAVAHLIARQGLTTDDLDLIGQDPEARANTNTRAGSGQMEVREARAPIVEME